jgi:transcription initiation factor TFIIIB Brf1 subunit/transcription initiation factor TFIIB
MCLGKNPRAVAAALYLAPMLRMMKKLSRKMSKTERTSSVTLRNRYKELKVLV